MSDDDTPTAYVFARSIGRGYVACEVWGWTPVSKAEATFRAPDGTVAKVVNYTVNLKGLPRGTKLLLAGALASQTHADQEALQEMIQQGELVLATPRDFAAKQEADAP